MPSKLASWFAKYGRAKTIDVAKNAKNFKSYNKKLFKNDFKYCYLKG